MHKIFHFLRRDDGPTAVEYAVMIAAVIAICFLGVMSMGTITGESFDDSATRIENAMPE
jgi:pilus assembly protein Flp/PilA